MFLIVRTEETQFLNQFRRHLLRLAVLWPAMNDTVTDRLYRSRAEMLLKPIHQYGPSHAVIQSLNGLSLRFLPSFVDDQHGFARAIRSIFRKETHQPIVRSYSANLMLEQPPFSASTHGVSYVTTAILLGAL